MTRIDEAIVRELHDLAHDQPGYFEQEDQNVLMALAPREIILILLGLSYVEWNHPCLDAATKEYRDRLEELCVEQHPDWRLD